MKKTLTIVLSLCMLFTCTAAFASVQAYKKGDANLDGKVTTGDATTVLRYSAGLADFSDDALISADFNSDGEINTGDVVSILRKCSFRVPTYDVHSRALSCCLYGLNASSASPEWPGYDWLQGKTTESNGVSLIYSATTRDGLDKFTDPALSPIKSAGGNAYDTESGSLVELTEKYDDEFFASYDLLFIAVFEPVVAKTVDITDACRMDGKLSLDVTIYYPEVCMQATNQHLVIVEVPKAYTDGVELELVPASVAYSSETDSWIPIP